MGGAGAGGVLLLLTLGNILAHLLFPHLLCLWAVFFLMCPSEAAVHCCCSNVMLVLMEGKVKNTVGFKVERTWSIRIFAWTTYRAFLKFSARTREHSSDPPLQFPRLQFIIIPNI